MTTTKCSEEVEMKKLWDFTEKMTDFSIDADVAVPIPNAVPLYVGGGAGVGMNKNENVSSVF